MVAPLTELIPHAALKRLRDCHTAVHAVEVLVAQRGQTICHFNVLSLIRREPPTGGGGSLNLARVVEVRRRQASILMLPVVVVESHCSWAMNAAIAVFSGSIIASSGVEPAVISEV